MNSAQQHNDQLLDKELSGATRWLHMDKFAEHRGLTRGVVQGWISRHLLRGIHYQVIGHQTLINTTEIDKWITEFGREESTPAGADSESKSSTAAKSYTKRRSQATLIPKLTLPQRSGDAMN